MSPVDISHISFWARDAASEITSAPETFSSWDKCMEKSYCKWPVIAGIIVGGVIILTIIACVVNCLCCGIRCCTGCCGCCCPSPRQKRPKYQDDPYHQQPPPMPVNTGYQTPQAPPTYPQAPPTYRGAQVARFDAPSSPAASKMNEDALPAMPSWDGAVTRRVEDTDPHADAVEMEPLNPMNHGPRRAPSAPRVNGGGYMGPPPVRTVMPHDYPNTQGYDEPSPYEYRSNGPSHSPISPYDQRHQPYRDYSPSNNYHAMSPPPNAYPPQPQYPVGVAISSSAEVSRPIPYRQPSPGISQPPSYRAMPSNEPPSTDMSRPIPYRQPSPGISQPPSYRAMSPNMPSSPPPPFPTTSNYEPSDPGRPPSLLQSGRKPVPNSYRDV